MAPFYCTLALFLSVVVVLVAGGVVRDDDDDDADPAPPHTKIVGGHEIEISQAPYMAHLQFSSTGTYSEQCGGSIINRRWILTAAHCTANYDKSQIVVTIGSKSRLSGGQKYRVENVKIHGAYNDNGEYSNDISVIKTTTDMKLDGLTTKAVTLAQPRMNPLAPKTSLRVSGWGFMENGQPPEFLRAVEFRVHPITDCNYRSSNETTEICAGVTGRNFCGGDSGGPVMMDKVQVGVVSNRNGDFPCGQRPSISMYVSSYVGWIKDHTSSL